MPQRHALLLHDLHHVANAAITLDDLNDLAEAALTKDTYHLELINLRDEALFGLELENVRKVRRCEELRVAVLRNRLDRSRDLPPRSLQVPNVDGEDLKVLHVPMDAPPL